MSEAQNHALTIGFYRGKLLVNHRALSLLMTPNENHG